MVSLPSHQLLVSIRTNMWKVTAMAHILEVTKPFEKIQAAPVLQKLIVKKKNHSRRYLVYTTGYTKFWYQFLSIHCPNFLELILKEDNTHKTIKKCIMNLFYATGVNSQNTKAFFSVLSNCPHKFKKVYSKTASYQRCHLVLL